MVPDDQNSDDNQADLELPCGSKRDLVSGSLKPKTALIRFVEGPDRLIVPDIAACLPGRGFWISASRRAVDDAVKRDVFSRAAKKRLVSPKDLSIQTGKLLRHRTLQGLSLARRSGQLVQGFNDVKTTLSAGKLSWLIVAQEASQNSCESLLRTMHIRNQQQKLPIEYINIFSTVELSEKLGFENPMYLGFLKGNFASLWGENIHKLSGFLDIFQNSGPELAN